MAAAVHLDKESGLGHAFTAAAGVRLPHLESVAARFEALAAQGDGDLDHSALHKLLWPEPRG